MPKPYQPIKIHLVKKVQIVLLLAKKVTILAKYLDFANIFSIKLAKVLPKQTRINKYAIKSVDNKQLPYRPIYNLGLVELKTLKPYIKTNLANGFIQPSKSSSNILILFVQKPKDSLYLYVNF